MATLPRNLLGLGTHEKSVIYVSDVGREALEAGADAFLRKPHDMGGVTPAVMRLLPEGNKNR